jgi:orotate phosphoribosyltransferase
MADADALDRNAAVHAAIARGADPLELLRVCGGYYECPRDASGKRRGPLVGYAGRDALGRQFVGDVYVNFAAAERYGVVLQTIARALWKALDAAGIGRIDGFCGAPEGGKALAAVLAMLADAMYLFPEKRITAVATEKSREQSELIFSRHEPSEGERWVVVEDVCNNFSTIARLVELTERYKARIVGVGCFLNRSVDVESEYIASRSGAPPIRLPIVSLVRKALPQYRQDDSAVAAEVAAGNVVWKPKNDWHRLAEAMSK